MHVRHCIISAPGKAILHGEHAVVHGKVALAVSLNLRTYLELKATSTGKVSIDLPNIDTFLYWDLSDLQPLVSESFAKPEEAQRLDPELLGRLREFVGVTNGNLDTRSMATLAFLYIYLSLFGSG
ncbi:mevalonate kinase [Gadus chalcogrammus]|uniref:mevalonate kinase n=1 Tax=Gadus chalcogrammus TaxID=1042646 RepID=UPI0024C49F34|nr:mevalonate kinase [Gadus chalcogrammus]